MQDIQASELQHAELEESAAARHTKHEEDRRRAAEAQREKDVLEAAVAAAERRLLVLQQQAQVGPESGVLGVIIPQLWKSLPVLPCWPVSLLLTSQ